MRHPTSGLRSCAAAAVTATLLAALAACGSDDGGDTRNSGAKPTSEDTSDVEAPVTDGEVEETEVLPEEPLLPAAPADLYVPDYDVTALSGTTVAPADPVIRLPGSTVTVDAITTIDSIEDPETYELVGPAEGEALKVVQLTWTPTEYLLDGAPGVTVQVDDAGQTTTLGAAEDVVSFVVSASDDALLVLKADGGAGEEVTVPLSTGVQDPNPVVDVLDRATIRQDLAEPLVFGTAKAVSNDGNSYTVAHQATVESAELIPFLSEGFTSGTARWAEEGETFLVVSVRGSEGYQAGIFGDYLDGSVVTATATVDGTTYEAIDKLHFDDGYEVTNSAVVVVPDTVTDVSLELTAVTQVLNSRARQVQHGSKKVTFAFI